MSTRKKALEVIEKIMRVIDEPPVETDRLVQEMKLWQFKIRHLSGDFTRAGFFESGIVRSLWKIGKIEEIVEDSFDSLSTREKEILMEYLDTLDDMEPYTSAGFDGKKGVMVKLEIFKDDDPTRPIN